MWCDTLLDDCWITSLFSLSLPSFLSPGISFFCFVEIVVVLVLDIVLFEFVFILSSLLLFAH